jgi:hypothetical protein
MEKFGVSEVAAALGLALYVLACNSPSSLCVPFLILTGFIRRDWPDDIFSSKRVSATPFLFLIMRSNVTREQLCGTAGASLFARIFWYGSQQMVSD